MNMDTKDMNLISLEEWNRRRRLLHKPIYPMKNGIACPECGDELMDVDDQCLMSNPPQRRTQCSNCPYHGYRVA